MELENSIFSFYFDFVVDFHGQRTRNCIERTNRILRLSISNCEKAYLFAFENTKEMLYSFILYFMLCTQTSNLFHPSPSSSFCSLIGTCMRRWSTCSLLSVSCRVHGGYRFCLLFSTLVVYHSNAFQCGEIDAYLRDIYQWQ